MRQVRNGKAFEFAIATNLENRFNVPIEMDNVACKAKDYYEQCTLQYLDEAANSAVEFLSKNDPRFQMATKICILPDKRGEFGDVRDIITILVEGNEIGLSAKHNNKKAKHPRISAQSDFGQEWTRFPVSDSYFGAISPIFERLQNEKRSYWNQIPDKMDNIYLPILSAFKTEVIQLSELHGEAFVQRLFQYLVGNLDYYKVICFEGRVIIQSFNINGTLEWGEILNTPKRIQCITRKQGSKTTLIVEFSKGWKFSFRIHNAKTNIESSLKFDIEFLDNGISEGVESHVISLN